MQDYQRVKEFYFDFETYKVGDPTKKDYKNTDTLVYHAGLLADRTYTGIGKDCLEYFWKKLKELTKGKRTIMVAHNVGYDLAFLIEGVHENIDKERIDKIEGQEDSGRKFLNARIKADGLNLVFKDTGRGDQFMSLEKWIKELRLTGIEKLVIDYKKGNVRTSGYTRLVYDDEKGTIKKVEVVKERDYLKNDLLALPKIRHAIAMTKESINKLSVLSDIQNPVGTTKAINNTMTKASFAKKSLEQYLGENLENKYRVKIEYPFYVLQDLSFIGGFTCGNKYISKLDLDKPDIRSYDVNSMYPSIMSIKLPFGYVQLTPPEAMDYVAGVVVRGSYCEYKQEGEFLDKHIISNTFKKIIKDGGEFIMLKDLYDLVIEFCNTDIYIDRTYYQRTIDEAGYYFIGLYKERDKYKNTDVNMANLIKILMNSTFGKLCEKYHESKFAGNKDTKQMDIVMDSKKDYRQMLTGLYVSTMGRCIMLKAIRDEVKNGNTFLYCDTDGIKLLVKNEPKLTVNNNVMGCWKDEGHFNVGRYPKKRKRGYAYNTETKVGKLASGGFNNRVINNLTHEEKLIFFDVDKNVRVVEGRRLKYRTKYNKTFIVDIDVFTNEQIDETHVMKKINDKGTII